MNTKAQTTVFGLSSLKSFRKDGHVTHTVTGAIRQVKTDEGRNPLESVICGRPKLQVQSSGSPSSNAGIRGEEGRSAGRLQPYDGYSRSGRRNAAVRWLLHACTCICKESKKIKNEALHLGLIYYKITAAKGLSGPACQCIQMCSALADILFSSAF